MKEDITNASVIATTMAITEFQEHKAKGNIGGHLVVDGTGENTRLKFVTQGQLIQNKNWKSLDENGVKQFCKDHQISYQSPKDQKRTPITIRPKKREP